jgi:hypothetical protein
VAWSIASKKVLQDTTVRRVGHFRYENGYIKRKSNKNKRKKQKEEV